MTAVLWRWDAGAEALSLLDARIDRALAEVDAASTTAQSAAERLVGALRERVELREQCEHDAESLRAGLVRLARTLNGALGLPDALAEVQSVLEEFAGPGVRVHPALDIRNGSTPGPRARAFLESVAALVTVAASARADHEEVDARVRRLEEGWLHLVDELRPSPPALTPREDEVLVLVREGFSNAAIAERLYVSVDTVKTHVRSLLDKYGVRGRAGLVEGPSKE